jgi:hypothetical protein
LFLIGIWSVLENGIEVQVKGKTHKGIVEGPEDLARLDIWNTWMMIRPG